MSQQSVQLQMGSSGFPLDLEMGYVQLSLHDTVYAKCSGLDDVSIGVLSDSPVHCTPSHKKLWCVYFWIVFLGYWLSFSSFQMLPYIINP